MRKARRIRVSGFYLLTDKEESPVADLARRIKAIWPLRNRAALRSMFRREIAEVLAMPSSVRSRTVRTRPARRRPGRRGRSRYFRVDLAIVL